MLCAISLCFAGMSNHPCMTPALWVPRHVPPPRTAVWAGQGTTDKLRVMPLAALVVFHTAALLPSAVFYGVLSCHPIPVLVQGESAGLSVMSVPAWVYPSLYGGVHNQGCAVLCEISLRQGHKKLVTAPRLANRFGGSVAFMLLGTSSFGFGHFHTRSSGCRATTEQFPPHHSFGTSFPQGISPAPCVRPGRDPRAGQQHQQQSAGDQHGRRAGSMSCCDECEGC